MTRDPLFWLAALTVLGFAAVLAEMVPGVRSLRKLAEVEPVRPEGAPAVSVVIAARDEERNIEEALASVLAMRYEPLEVIVVDDRSTDRTGEILDRMAASAPRLRVVHVAELPAGWLGKNHALHLGAAEARGEYLLFTDADVVLDPTLLGRAVAYVRARGVDHLAAGPRVLMRRSPLLRAFVVAFTLMFAMAFRPWRARDPRSRGHIGVGAFNLVRSGAYRSIGGHRPVAMRPDDDIKLGKVLKKSGFRQDFVVVGEMVSVEWYASFREMVRGLMKNGFAGVDYRLSVVVLATVAQLVFFVFPWAAVFFTTGWTQLLFGICVLVPFLLYAGAAREQGVSPVYGVTFPLMSLIFLYVIWRATVLTLFNGGIEWRGTHYPLDQLRANEV